MMFVTTLVEIPGDEGYMSVFQENDPDHYTLLAKEHRRDRTGRRPG
jgi:hypothetical protein